MVKFFLILMVLYVIMDAKNISKVEFNQDFIESVNAKAINLDNKDEVLSFLLSKMNREITVYPTEGYYYFEFMNNGELIRGNIRFDNKERDEGKATFAYFKEQDDENVYFRILDKSNKFFLTKLSNFKYKLKYKNFTKIVNIYDAKKELSNLPKLLANEEYIGPVFDESGVRFHLIFDHNSKYFLYLLNDKLGYAETYRDLDNEHNLIIGTRTKFIYFNDKKRARYILVGVNKKSIDKNNYYDGPFDQLPDSFMDGKLLKNLIIEYEPSVKNKIKDYGIYINDETSRYAITSYISYLKKEETFVLYKCIDKSNNQIDKCLKYNIDND